MSSSAKSGAAGAYAGRTFIILNPAAGQDTPDRMRRMIGAAFTARRASFDLAETRGPGDAIELARQAVRLGYRAVCVVGGDGTLAEAATGLAGTDVPLAIIPRGTANQVAQNLRIPTDLEAAVEVVVDGVPAPMDLGRVDGRAFALVAGAGFDADVMAAATRPLKERWGFGAYVFALVSRALAAAPTQFRVRADDREIEVRAVSVMIANVGELFASFLPFTLPLAPQPARSWQDGLLDVIIVAPRNLTEFAVALWKATHHRFGESGLIHLQAREVSVEADPPAQVQIDGDPAGQTPITAASIPGGVQVLTPGG